MDRKQKVLLMLKPKVKQFGFNKKELQGIAAKIADNLTSADDASDEDVNAEIEEKIDAVLPYLQVSQSYANRLVEDARKRLATMNPMTMTMMTTSLHRKAENVSRGQNPTKPTRKRKKMLQLGQRGLLKPWRRCVAK